MEANGTLHVVGDLAEDVAHRFAGAACVTTLSEVPAWGRIVEIVGQDEYTNDVVVDAGAAYLVFDTT